MTMLYPAMKTPGATIPIQLGTSAGASAAAAAPEEEGFFSRALHEVIDVVNPLQHLPVVGTLYRAITGDKIGTVEKIAGDALYGGLWGAVSSVADAAFEAVTGKDFGSTVLALFTGDHAGKPAMAVAAAAPAVTTPASIAMAAQSSEVYALSRSLAAKGVSNDVAARALDAYRKATGTVLAAAN